MSLEPLRAQDTCVESQICANGIKRSSVVSGGTVVVVVGAAVVVVVVVLSKHALLSLHATRPGSSRQPTVPRVHC